MQDQSIGQICANKDCKRLDYLPFLCKHCDKYYCNDHVKNHGCGEESKDMRAI